MAEPAPKNDASNPAPDALDDAHAESIVNAFNALLGGLSPAQRERVRAKLFQSASSNSTPRPGQVLGTILKFVPRDRAFTVQDVQKSVAAEGVQATAKAIYNALGYLTRKQKITRIGHGRYIVDGAMLETTEDLGVGPPTRHEIDDT